MMTAEKLAEMAHEWAEQETQQRRDRQAAGTKWSFSTATPTEIEDALRHIPNHDVPYDYYLRIMMAIKNALGDAGEGVADRWAAQSGKYNSNDQSKYWRSINAVSKNGTSVTGATIFYEAMNHGWQKPAGASHTKTDEKTGPDDADVNEEQSAGKKKRKSWYAAAVASAITAHGDNFAQDPGAVLCVQRKGVYVLEGVEHVRRRVRKIIVPTSEWSSKLANETAEYLRTASPQLWDTPPCNILNVANGLLHIEKLELREHTPEHLSLVQLPVRYDPAATCPAWEKQVEETFPPDAVKAGVAWQIVALLMVPYTALQKAILLLGGGGTGKSTFLTAVINFLGRRNVSSVTLQKLEYDRFATSRLVGKLANIFADLPATHLESSSMFKSLTGGDLIPAERKFKDAFDFTPFARMLFSANEPPLSHDATDAFFQRWYVLPFTQVYRGTKQEVSRIELDARLSAPTELSGALNRAVAALPEVLKNGVTVTASMRAAFEEFQATTDPLAVWLTQNTVDDPASYVACDRLIGEYNKILAGDSRAILTKTAFGRALNKLRPKVVVGQRRVGANPKAWCYVGINLKAANGYSDEDQPWGGASHD